jgi:hypothetical protein
MILTVIPLFYLIPPKNTEIHGNEESTNLPHPNSTET